MVLLLAACAAPLSESVPPADLDPRNPDSMSLRAELFSDDVAGSVAFYTGVLGFTLENDDPGYAVVRAGDVTFGIAPKGGLGPDHYFNPELGTERVGLGAEFVLEVDDIENYYAAVVQADWPRESELVRQGFGLTDFRVADPDGYYLRITSRD
jgi:lactoylglutathione lyase